MAETNPNENLSIEMANKMADAIFGAITRPRPVRSGSQPTPGTWRVSQNGDVVSTVDGSEYVVCWTDADCALSEEEQIANSKLIALAPVYKSIVRDLIAAWDKCDASGLSSLILRAKLAASLEVR